MRSYALALMLVAACTLLAASLIHFGVVVPLGVATLYDPFAGAALPEGILAGVLAVGVVFLMQGQRRVALVLTLLTLLLTLYGFSVTLRAALIGDIAYHVTLIGMLVTLVVVLLRPARQMV